MKPQPTCFIFPNTKICKISCRSLQISHNLSTSSDFDFKFSKSPFCASIEGPLICLRRPNHSESATLISFLESSMAATVKALAQSSDLQSVPSPFTYQNDAKGSYSDSIPIVDFAQLTSPEPELRTESLFVLANACEKWGFFILINHGIPEKLSKDILKASLEFFDLPDDEKKLYEGKSAADPIKTGTGTAVDTAGQEVYLWRDFVKAYVHPEFHCPQRPQGLRDVLMEYSGRTRLVARKLLVAISDNLGLEEGYMDRELRLDSCFQVFGANFFPTCPQPEQAIGLPPHSDYGLLTFLIHNGVDGLQILHNGQWFNTNSPDNSILVNTGDHLEIFSNGRYKSVKHRAVVNSEVARIAVVMATGPAPEVVVGPAQPLVERDGRALYRPMKYIEYVEKMLTNRLAGRSSLDSLKIDLDK